MKGQGMCPPISGVDGSGSFILHLIAWPSVTSHEGLGDASYFRHPCVQLKISKGEGEFLLHCFTEQINSNLSQSLQSPLVSP